MGKSQVGKTAPYLENLQMNHLMGLKNLLNAPLGIPMLASPRVFPIPAPIMLTNATMPCILKGERMILECAIGIKLANLKDTADIHVSRIVHAHIFRVAHIRIALIVDWVGARAWAKEAMIGPIALLAVGKPLAAKIAACAIRIAKWKMNMVIALIAIGIIVMEIILTMTHAISIVGNLNQSKDIYSMTVRETGNSCSVI